MTPVFSCLRDLSRSLANMNELKRRRLQPGTLTECGEQSFAILLSRMTSGA
jgi:hypothetical protein